MLLLLYNVFFQSRWYGTLRRDTLVRPTPTSARWYTRWSVVYFIIRCVDVYTVQVTRTIPSESRYSHRIRIQYF